MDDLLVETPVETVETVEVEAPAEEAPIPEPTDALDAEVVTEGDAETPLDDAETTDVESAPVEEVTLVTFDAELETSALIEQGKAEVEKYDVPQPLQAYIEALEARVDTPSVDPEMAPYQEVLPQLVHRQNLLDTIEEVDGVMRPRTDLYVQEITDEGKRAWLYHDLASSPSEKYPGLVKFQESIADGLHIEGESYQDTIDRYNDTMTAMRTGVTIVPDVPACVPANLQEAFSRLPKDTREWIANLDLSNEFEAQSAADQVAQLELIQKGLDADKANAVREAQSRDAQQFQRQNRVIETQVKFYDTFRDNFATDLLKEVTFSTDSNIQAISAAQNVALLEQALQSDASGEFARKSLKAAGIKFDHQTALQLQKDVEKAAISLANAESVQGMGDKVALNRATEEFKIVGKKWHAFAKDIIGQQARLVSTGKAEEVKDAVAKQKIEVKARQVPKGTPTAAVKKEVLPAYGSPEWDKYWARKTMEEQAQKAARYQTA